MKQKLLRWILVLSMLHVSCSVVYAESMNLIYDGKVHQYSNKPIHLYIDGQEIVTTVMPPIQLNNSVLVPAREVFTMMGAEVEWRPTEQSVYIHNEESLIVIKMNSYEAWVNGEVKQLNTPAKLINDKVMIPLRFISESLGYTVKWVQSEYTIYITTLKESNNEVINKPSDTNSTENGKDIEDNDILDDIVNNDQIEEIKPIAPESNTDSIFNNQYINYNDTNNTLTLSSELGMTANQISYTENEHTKQIIINLNGDYSRYLPYGTFKIEGNRITQVDIMSQNGQTRLVVTTSTVSALMTKAENGQVIMQLVKPSEKYKKIVVLDAGHGNFDPGTTYEGIKEKDINLSVSNALRNILEEDPNIKVYTTREDDTFIELMDRVAFSNEIEPDLFISMHVNSVQGNTSASGTETYYTVASDTRNKIFATMVQQALVKEFGTRDRGVKTASFVVTKYTDAPAILIEIGFLTNSADRSMMTSDGFERRYAQTVYQCILNYYAQGLND